MYLYVCPVAGGNVMCLKLCEVGHEHDGRPEASRQEDRDSAAKRKCTPEHRCQQCGRDLCPAHVCDGELHDEYTVRDLGSDVEEVEYEHERQQLCVEALTVVPHYCVIVHAFRRQLWSCDAFVAKCCKKHECHNEEKDSYQEVREVDFRDVAQMLL